METNSNEAKLSKLSIAVGALSDLIGSLIFGAVFGITLAMFSVDPESSNQLVRVIVFAIGFILGLGFDVVGGFVAAYRAGYRLKTHAMWSGISVVVWGIFTTFIPFLIKIHADSSEIWQLSTIGQLSIFLVIPAAYLGGMFAEYMLANYPNFFGTTSARGVKAESVFSWKVSEQELNSQIEQYKELALSKSYRGRVVIFFCIVLLYSFIVVPLAPGSIDIMAVLFGAIVYAPFIYFAYCGYRWALWSLLLLFTWDKFATVFLLAKGYTPITVGLTISVFVWVLGVLLIAKAIRVENMRRANIPASQTSASDADEKKEQQM